jgi:hypothetical protein
MFENFGDDFLVQEGRYIVLEVIVPFVICDVNKRLRGGSIWFGYKSLTDKSDRESFAHYLWEETQYSWDFEDYVLVVQITLEIVKRFCSASVEIDQARSVRLCL